MIFNNKTKDVEIVSMWLPLRMRGATAAALRVLPPKARGTGEFRTAVSAHAVRHCAARRCTLAPRFGAAQ